MSSNSADAARVWQDYGHLLEPVGFTRGDLDRLSPAGVLAVNWLVDTILFRQYEQLGLRTKTIVYCQLLKDPVRLWADVFDWMGLQMDSAVERFLDHSSHPAFDVRRLLGRKYTYFSVQRGDRSPLESWKHELTRSEIDEILSVVSPFVDLEQHWPDSPSSCRPTMSRSLC